MLVVVCVALATGCAPGWKHGPHDELYQHAAAPRLHRMPATSSSQDWWDRALHSTVLPLAQTFSPRTYVAAAVGGRPALDVNAFGNVPDSTWYENRITRAPMTVEQMARGPNESDGPADGTLTVISGKTEGVSPGFVVRDTADVVWFVKFDAPAYPELTTAAELVASRILYAAGYHVPETFLVTLQLERLRLAKGAETRDEYNRRVPLTQHELEVLLVQLNPKPDGTLRAMFSRAVPGKPLGPFSYRGTRPDDPNDRLPHERRRSLRGLWVVQALINNVDTRRQNTLDTFIPVSEDGELGYVMHFLIDFGDSLGASSSREKYLSEGYEHQLDWAEMGKRFIAFGLSYPYWLSVKRTPFRGVGIFEGEVFDPDKWAPRVPNSAFDQATRRDTFWAAAILARMSREHLAAAAAAGELSETGATELVTEVLVQRRDRLLDYGFRGILALDDPSVEDGYVVRLTDLEVSSGRVPEPVAYTWSARWDHTGGIDHELGRGTTDTPAFDLRDAVTRAMTDHASGFREDPYMTLTIRRAGKSAEVHVHLRVVRDHVVPVGLERDVN